HPPPAVADRALPEREHRRGHGRGAARPGLRGAARRRPAGDRQRQAARREQRGGGHARLRTVATCSRRAYAALTHRASPPSSLPAASKRCSGVSCWPVKRSLLGPSKRIERPLFCTSRISAPGSIGVVAAKVTEPPAGATS